MEAPRDETIPTVLVDMPTTGGGSAAVAGAPAVPGGAGADAGNWPNIKMGRKPNERSSGIGTTCRREVMTLITRAELVNYKQTMANWKYEGKGISEQGLSGGVAVLWC